MSITKRVRLAWRAARFLAVRVWLQLLARVAPRRHEQMLLRLWLTPMQRGRPSGPVTDWHWTGVDRVALYDQGDGPTVLLVHGWEGSAADMRELAEAFVRAGYRALRIDLPAHGASSGRWTTLLHWASTIRDVVDRSCGGRLAAIVGHSLGGAAALVAVRDGVQADCAAVLAPPREARSFFLQFAHAFGVPADRRDGALRALETMVGPLDEFDGRNVARALRIAGLVVHDRGDRQVPYEHGRSIAVEWRGAELVTLEGLGHRRLLADTTVIERVVDFVQSRRYGSALEASGA